jgi:hypothetical protein
MFRRPTWIALVIVVILVGVLFYTNREQKIVEQVAETFPTLPSHTVIPDEDGTPTRIIFESATGGVVEVALNMQNGWDVILPFEGAANKGNVEAAVNEIDTMRYVSELKDVAPADLGLDSPAYVLTLHFKNGAKHVIEIGDKTPSETGYYIRLDGKRLLVMENSAVESLLFLIGTPPYQETPTPSPQPSTATSTGAPLPTETVTPAP